MQNWQLTLILGIFHLYLKQSNNWLQTLQFVLEPQLLFLSIIFNFQEFLQKTTDTF